MAVLAALTPIGAAVVIATRTVGGLVALVVHGVHLVHHPLAAAAETHSVAQLVVGVIPTYPVIDDPQGATTDGEDH